MNVAARHLLHEAHKRFAAPPTRASAVSSRVADMLATRFDKQRNLILHPARRKAALCTRRAGKTESVASYILKEAAEHPGSLIIFMAITRARAEELLWAPLKEANSRFGFGGEANNSKLWLTLPNGSVVRLTGADKINEAEKKRGDKTRLVLVDEAQMYPPDILRRLVDDILGPTLEDLQGTLVLLGTPGPVCEGYWYEVTRNEDDEARASRLPGWEVFEWSVLDNPFMAHMKERLPQLKAERGWDDSNATWLREWCGRWVNDADALFYSFDGRRNLYDGTLPPGHQWVKVAGADLGYSDAFAYHVWAFSETHPDLFEVESFAQSGLMPAQWAQHLRGVVQRHNPARLVVDAGGLGKPIIVEWQVREQLPVEAAEKTHKPAFVALFNSDMTSGRVKLRTGGVTAGEMAVLPKDPDDPTKEHPRFPNHASDAALYAWREALHFLGRHPGSRPEPGSPEALQAQADAWEAEAERELQRQQREAHEAWEDS